MKKIDFLKFPFRYNISRGICLEHIWSTISRLDQQKMGLKRKICSFLLFIFLLNPLEIFQNRLESDELDTVNNSEKVELNIDNNYLLGPGDVIDIIFFWAEEFSGRYRILKDGFLYLPVVGSINLSEISVAESAKKIEKLYSSELLRPQVQINLVSSRSIQISILGEVAKQGIYKINVDPTNKGNFSRVTDAIKKAGGITEDANIKEVEVIRKSGLSEYPLIKTKIDLHSLITKGNTSQNLILFDGDVIKIPKAESNLALDVISSSNLNDFSMQVYVIGEVKKPGVLTMNSNSTLIEAVLNSGGPIKWRGNKGNVRLIRFGKNGTLSSKKIKLSLNPNSANKDNPKLIEGDVIEVRSSKLANVTDGLAIVSKPLQSVVNIFALGKILND